MSQWILYEEGSGVYLHFLVWLTLIESYLPDAPPCVYTLSALARNAP